MNGGNLLSLIRLMLIVSVAALGTQPCAAQKVAVGEGPIWRRHVIDDSSRGADGVKLGDINVDGRPDIVTGWEEGGVVRVYLHPGPAEVRQRWPRVTVGQAANVEDAVFVDLDGDGRLEVISCCEGKTNTVYRHRFSANADSTSDSQLLDARNWSTEPLPTTQAAEAWMQAIAFDVDGRHGVDLVVASKNSRATISWLPAPADPWNRQAWRLHRLRAAGWIMTLGAYDMNGDGDTDIVFTDRRGPRSGAFWLEHPGRRGDLLRATWKEHSITALQREAMFMDLGDIDGDGRQDAAVAVKPREIHLAYQQHGSPWRQVQLMLSGEQLGDAKAVRIADINGDGRADLVFSCEHAEGARAGVVWLEQLADANWRQRPLGGAAGAKFDLMQVLDLDDDGDLDVLTCEERDQLGVVWYENPHRAP